MITEKYNNMLMNNSLTIKTKKLNEKATLPIQMHADDAGFDLVATSKRIDHENYCTIYGTGLAFEIPEGYAMFIYPRSSCYKHAAMMANCVAVIDAGYRGEVHIVFKGFTSDYEVGERIAQAVIMPIPRVEYTEVGALTDSDRGNGGLGSTGTK